MLDKLIELFLQFLDLFKFWYVLDPYENGVILTLGKVRRKKHLRGAGLHFIIPFGIERIADIRMDMHSVTLKPQTLMTADGVCVTVRMNAIWRTHDPMKLLLEIASDLEVLVVNIACTLTEAIRLSKWEDIIRAEWHDQFYKNLRRKTFKYGIEVIECEIVELTRMDGTIRLYNE